MEIRILDREEQARIYDDVLEMMIAADRDFVPPLSSRSSSTQKDLTNVAAQSPGRRDRHRLFPKTPLPSQGKCIIIMPVYPRKKLWRSHNEAEELHQLG